jgi:DNA polymerase-3 subunit epsilon
MQKTDLEGLARRLEADPDFRVLRRIRARQEFERTCSDRVRLGLVLDVETTGLKPEQHEIIELAILPFSFTLEGRVIATHEPFVGLRQPSQPIPPEITRITGLDDAAVAGTTISVEAVAAFIEPAALIIAHNSAFDRRFAERFCDAFVHKPWACSQSEIDWAAEGFEGTKLFYLAARHGLFFDGHRALDDCRALVEVLARPLPQSGETGLARLLTSARRPTLRVWAIAAPFETKEVLRSRGYRWSDGSDGQPRAWNRDVSVEAAADEIAFLQTEIGIEPITRTMDAFSRFSERV